MNLTAWAIRHGVPFAALDELRAEMGIYDAPEHDDGDSEAAAQKRVQLEASQLGGRLWRNNVGALLDARGVPVRYGLCNESAQVNKVCKSSDLIGVMPLVITPRHLGTTVGVFTAREMKKPGWTYKGDAHEKAQHKYIELVAKLGGDASFATGVGTLGCTSAQ